MSRLLWVMLVVGLAACSQSATSPTGGRPDLPTGAEVRYPAAPGGTPVYLSLLSDAGESFYQVTAAAGSTATTVDPSLWRGREAGKTAAISALLPTGATNVVASEPSAQVLALRWVMWQDRNSDGVRQDSEVLPLLSHDRVVYADRPVTLRFTTATPDMAQRWTFAAGWTRAAHLVYLPSGSGTYIRTLSSDPLQRYELHLLTPVTSQ